MFDPSRRATFTYLVLIELLSLASCQRHGMYPKRTAGIQSSTILTLSMGSLSVADPAIGQANASVVVGCVDSSGLTFSNITLSIANNATISTSTTATFSVGQKAGYLAYGRSISCNLDIVYPGADVSIIAANNATCWFSYTLFAGTADVAATSTSWTCTMSGASYVLMCPSCTTTTSSSTTSTTTNSAGLSSGEVQTICLVIGCGLVAAIMVMFGCSRLSKWRHTDARDTRHLPEDMAKDVNLRPPKLIVAHYASQRAMDSPAPVQSNIRKSVDTRPPVMIVSYGSQSTPQAQNFHHGAYAIAQPETPRLQMQDGKFLDPSRSLQPLPDERPVHLHDAAMKAADIQPSTRL